MGVSENRGTPKPSILIEISIVNHPFWGTTIFGNTHMVIFEGFAFTLGVWFGLVSILPPVIHATLPKTNSKST